MQTMNQTHVPRHRDHSRHFRQAADLLNGPRGALALLVVLAGCGNLTAGGATGEAVVIVSGDAAETTLSSVPGVASLVTSPSRSDHDDSPEGQLEAELRIALVKENGVGVLLGQDVIEVRVDLEGIEEDEVANQVLEAGLYTELRLLFLQIEVQVDEGLVINGVEVTGPIDIDIEDSLAVSRPLDLEILPGERSTLLVDLNSASWLQAVDPATSTVDPQVFADLIAVSIR